jgi:hypothetical protein
MAVPIGSASYRLRVADDAEIATDAADHCTPAQSLRLLARLMSVGHLCACRTRRTKMVRSGRLLPQRSDLVVNYRVLRLIVVSRGSAGDLGGGQVQLSLAQLNNRT